jgi:hypothetical protein
MFDLVRGPHSTGLAAANRSGDITVYKTTQDGYGFATDPRAVRTVNHTHSVLIGHNRFATQGAQTQRNAHPFEHGLIVGAHNGTLQNAYDLDDWKDFQVDSDCLFHNIAKDGITKTIEKARGAWALTWYDGADNTINMLRNDQRPLVFAYDEDKKRLVWASESWILNGTVGRRDFKFHNNKILVLPENMLYSWEVPKANEAFGAPFRKAIKGAPPKAYPSYHNGWWLQQQKDFEGDLADSGVKEPATAGPKAAGKAGKTGEVVPFVLGSHRGFGGVLISDEAYQQHMDDGCMACTSNTIFQNEKPMYIAEDEWLCPDCVQGNYARIEETLKRKVN